MKISYRPTVDSDYEFCRILHHHGMKPYVEPLWGWNDEFQNQRYKGLWQPINMRIIKSDDKDAGYIEVSVSSEAIKLVNVFVTENFRGRGIGKQVILDFINQYKGAAPKLTLNVLWNNPAQHLYQRLGFNLVNREDQIMKFELCLK